MSGHTAPAPRMAYATNKAAATALVEHAAATDPEQPPYSAFPYSWQSPEFTPWWLVRKPYEKPAYPSSKLEVRQLKDGPAAGLATVGFRVEKGFSPNYGKQCGKPLVQQLGQQWAWHAVVRALAGGELDGALDQVAFRTGLPVVVEVSISALHEAGDAGKPYEERVVLLSRGTASGLVLESAATDELAALNECGALRELGEHLGQPDWKGFFWGSLRLGVRLDYAAAGQPAWDASELWERACAPWLPWT
jgi:hypothetical protein